MWGSIDLFFVWVVEIDLVFLSGHGSWHWLSFRLFYIALTRGVKFHIKSWAKSFKESVDVLAIYYIKIITTMMISSRYLSMYWNTIKYYHVQNSTTVNTPHALRASVVIVYALVPVRAHEYVTHVFICSLIIFLRMIHMCAAEHTLAHRTDRAMNAVYFWLS